MNYVRVDNPNNYYSVIIKIWLFDVYNNYNDTVKVSNTSDEYTIR